MLWLAGLILIALGLILIVFGLIERPFEDFREVEEIGEETRERRKKKVTGGGVVIIGPIPIVFGESRYAFYALVLSIVLMVALVLISLSLSTG